MNFLFIHQNFPGQFTHLAAHFAASPGNRVVAICQGQAPGLKNGAFPAVAKTVYHPHRKPSSSNHPYLARAESQVLNGQGVARALLQLRRKGFEPDIAIAHTGWGEAMYFKDVFPDVPLIGYCEFYYRSVGADVGFDPEESATIDDRLRIRTLNTAQLLTLPSIDVGVSPTKWQRSLYPPEYQNKIRVIHEGINARRVLPECDQKLMLPNGMTLTKEMEVVTYTARGLEPYRGFPVFMRAVDEICRRRPRCHIVITGGDEVRYGKRLENNQSYREKLLNDVTVDRDRVHFLGIVPYDMHLKILQVSSAHVYLTVPFVLSWSMLEAMATECVIIGSATPPVQEIIVDRHNGLLFDYFSWKELADRVDEVLDDLNRKQSLGKNAREDIIEKYKVEDRIEEYKDLCRELIPGF
jgi:glycosyltransferase involved in cell wall biosynthesis